MLAPGSLLHFSFSDLERPASPIAAGQLSKSNHGESVTQLDFSFSAFQFSAFASGRPLLRLPLPGRRRGRREVERGCDVERVRKSGDSQLDAPDETLSDLTSKAHFRNSLG